MWEFLDHLLERGGTTAVLFVLNSFASLAVIRHLQRKLDTALADVRRAQDKAQSEVLRLQERRIEEARVAMANAEKMKVAVDQIRSTMNTLVEVMSGRRR